MGLSPTQLFMDKTLYHEKHTLAVCFERSSEVGDAYYSFYTLLVYPGFRIRDLSPNVLRKTYAMYRFYTDLQIPLLLLSLIALDLIAYLEIAPAFEAYAALATFTHLNDVFLDVLERFHGPYRLVNKTDPENMRDRVPEREYPPSKIFSPFLKTLTFAFFDTVPFLTLHPAIDF
jgi:hypothetical protein